MKSADILLRNDTASMTILGHLTELRRRLVISLAAIACGMAVSYYFIDEIIRFLTLPAGHLYFMKPAEAFFIYFKVALITGAIAASPILFYEFWAFIIPAFSQKGRSLLAMLVPSSLSLFAGGIVFAYYCIIPQSLQFFMNFSNDIVQPMLSMEGYLDFIGMLLLPFGFIFNLPMLLMVLAKADILHSRTLKKGRRCVIFFSFVAAAIITPTTDIVSQTLMAVPIVILYEASIFLIQYVLKK